MHMFQCVYIHIYNSFIVCEIEHETLNIQALKGATVLMDVNELSRAEF